MTDREAYTHRYPRPMVCVDAVVFRELDEKLEVLLIRRGKPPFTGMHALPGGFLEMEEDLPAAAARELHEEAGLVDVGLTQLAAFGRPDRDPRGRCISIAFIGFVASGHNMIRAGDDAAEVAWHSVSDLPPLAFDHSEIIAVALASHLRCRDEQSVL